jgi:hypothetical protein
MVRRNLVLEPALVEQPPLTRFQLTHHRQTPSQSIRPRQNHGSGKPATRLFQQLRLTRDSALTARIRGIPRLPGNKAGLQRYAQQQRCLIVQTTPRRT